MALQCYVLPLWITLCLHIMARNRWCQVAVWIALTQWNMLMAQHRVVMEPDVYDCLCSSFLFPIAVLFPFLQRCTLQSVSWTKKETNMPPLSQTKVFCLSFVTNYLLLFINLSSDSLRWFSLPVADEEMLRLVNVRKWLLKWSWQW